MMSVDDYYAACAGYDRVPVYESPMHSAMPMPPPTGLILQAQQPQSQWPSAAQSRQPEQQKEEIQSPTSSTPSSSLATNTISSSTPSSAATGKKSSRRRSGKQAYKHVPHREKPPHLVERRNARERRRVQAVNTAFSRLRKCVPAEHRNKRLSKVKTLQNAIEYISFLQQILSEDDCNNTESHLERLADVAINKENAENSRWSPLQSDSKESSLSSFTIPLYNDYSPQGHYVH